MAKKAISGSAGDFGTYFRHQASHGDEIVLDETMRAGVRRARVVTSQLLERLYRRGELDPGDSRSNALLYDAGVRLRNDWVKAGLTPRQTMRYQVAPIPGVLTPAEAEAVREDARRAYIAAMRHVGPIASDELVEVCCLDYPIGRFRLILLRRGLRVLADWYGLWTFEKSA